MYGVIAGCSPGSMLAAAATRVGQAAVFDGLLWFGALLLAVGGAAVVASWVRRRMRASSLPGEPSFSISQLRRLRDQGTITKAEYERLLRQATRGVQDASNRHTCGADDKMLQQAPRT